MEFPPERHKEIVVSNERTLCIYHSSSIFTIETKQSTDCESADTPQLHVWHKFQPEDLSLEADDPREEVQLPNDEHKFLLGESERRQ